MGTKSQNDTMARVKIHLEYVLNVTSKDILWDSISTPAGLEGWFADKVDSRDKLVTFRWGKDEERQANIVGIRSYSYIRFRWLDNPFSREFFELRMGVNELTNDYTLEIKDYADEDDVDDIEDIWNSQIETLRRIRGF